jgi:hypothetical protein
MAGLEKICPLTKEKCDPFDWTNKEAANRNCTFYVTPEHTIGQCLYIEAMRSMPKISEAIKNLKIST